MKCVELVSLVAALLLLSGESHATAQAADALGFSRAVKTEVKAQMVSDLQMLSDLQGTQATPLFQRIFGGLYSGATVLDFFTNRIQSVDMDDCGGGAGDTACVDASVDPHKMFLTGNYVTFDMPQIARLSIVVHESRHSEVDKNGWAHATCPIPFLDPNGRPVVGLVSHAKMEGIPACDYTAFGAYGVQLEFLKNTQLNCQNCNDKTKLDAQIFGDDMINRIIDARANQALRADVGLKALTKKPMRNRR